jgi:hypothetical protein
MLKDVRHENILEVGNVLSNYFNMKHDIVDKYEMIDDVIQQDIVDYSPIKTYELIVSISTIEHIGFDENIKEPDKVIKAIENLKSLLEPKGKIIVSFPMGYNTYLDNLYMQNIFLFQHRFCLKRISRLNFWKEVPLSKIVNPKYDYPYPSGNWVVFGIFDNS